MAAAAVPHSPAVLPRQISARFQDKLAAGSSERVNDFSGFREEYATETHLFAEGEAAHRVVQLGRLQRRALQLHQQHAHLLLLTL